MFLVSTEPRSCSLVVFRCNKPPSGTVPEHVLEKTGRDQGLSAMIRRRERLERNPKDAATASWEPLPCRSMASIRR